MQLLRKLVTIAVVLTAPLLITACMTDSLPTDTIASVNQSVTRGYRITAGDNLRVTIFDEPELTGEYSVGDGGTLALPLIDAINAGGLTSIELTELIASRYRAGGYVLAPRVAVEVLEQRPFYILGEVGEPGEYPYSGTITLEQAIAIAGGYTPRADRGWVILRREDWDTARLLRLDGTALRIAPGDTITVRESFF